MANHRVIIQRKLFQRCTHLLYCSALFLCDNVNTRRMSQSDIGSIFHIKKSMIYSGQRKLLCELTKFSYFNAFILLGYCCIYSCLQIPPRENWVSICTQSMRNLQLTFLALFPWQFTIHNVTLARNIDIVAHWFEIYIARKVDITNVNFACSVIYIYTTLSDFVLAKLTSVNKMNFESNLDR